MSNNFIVCFALITLFALPARAEILQEVFEKYADMAPHEINAVSEDIFAKYSQMAEEQFQIVAGFPGRIIGDLPKEHKSFFTQKWKMRSVSYELYFADAKKLAESVFELAIFANDVDADFPKDKFLRGVLGFHYSGEQVVNFANSLFKKELATKDYPYLIQILLEDKVLKLTDKGFEISPQIHHVLAASAGKKRTFAATLEHERLHVFWDEDPALRERQIKKWNALSEEQKNQVKKDLHQYAKGNEAQLIEEWSVHSTENSNFSLF